MVLGKKLIFWNKFMNIWSLNTNIFVRLGFARDKGGIFSKGKPLDHFEGYAY